MRQGREREGDAQRVRNSGGSRTRMGQKWVGEAEGGELEMQGVGQCPRMLKQW